jgi:hypothetical protein
MERSSMGLPPLFKPIFEHDPVLAGRPKKSPVPSRIAGFNNGIGVGGVGAGTGAVITGNSGLGGVARRILIPGELPEFQDFKNAKVAGETFFTICCSEQYSSFSPEVCIYSSLTPILIRFSSCLWKGITMLLA